MNPKQFAASLTRRFRGAIRDCWTELRADWRGIVRRQTPRFVAPLLLFASLILLRHQLVLELRISYSQAIGAGLIFGWYYDLFVVTLAVALSYCAWAVIGGRRAFWWVPFAFSVWLITASNVIHYRFFGMRLDLWIVELHWRDFFVVEGSARQLSLTWAVVASAILGFASLLAAPLRHRIFHAQPQATKSTSPWWKMRARRLAISAAIVLLSFVTYRTPRALEIIAASTMVSDNIVRMWISHLTSRRLYAGAGKKWTGRLGESMSKEKRSEPARQLALYRDFHEGLDSAATPSEVVAESPPSELESWPLLTDLAPTAEQTRQARELLGLPTEGPINIIMLFLESTRAFELYHPELGPAVFPNLRRVLEERAISFPLAYSSSFTAGQTVRGQFSTLCSMLPNIAGAATYVAHNTLRVRCLQQLLKENGYQTTWMNTYRSTFHGKRSFETLHGTEVFYDGDAFRDRGVTQVIGNWGLADGPFLREVVKLHEEHAALGKPIFSNVLTISVHHPYSEISEGKLPKEIVEATGSNWYYRGYLSRLRYTDIAIGEFFDRLFESSIADNTLVALLGDHSTAVGPYVPITGIQLQEMRFRIPMALVTKNMPHPEERNYAVHQVDLAPTLARVAGAKGRVAWVGKDLLKGAGSPWVFESHDIISYRTASRACYQIGAPQPHGCWDVTEQDPLFDKLTVSVPEDPEITKFFRDVLTANMRAIALNIVLPVSETP